MALCLRAIDPPRTSQVLAQRRGHGVMSTAASPPSGCVAVFVRLRACLWWKTQVNKRSKACFLLQFYTDYLILNKQAVIQAPCCHKSAIKSE